MLIITILLPLFAIASISLFTTSIIEALWIAIGYSLIELMHTLLLIHLFENNTSLFLFLSCYGKLGLDGISLWLVSLISILMPIVLLSTWRSIIIMPRYFIIALLFIAFWSYAVFLVLDLFFFYISFESVLIPMYLIIGHYGGRNRKILAGHLFFIYTLFGSLFLLFAIILLYLETGSSDYLTLLTSPLSPSRQSFLWLGFFLAFAIKVPMIPFHIWLPSLGL